ncbi:MAG: pknD [Chlamydiales bacterium]|jgi:serine/threonine-protein kinase|nr:pknD [Chlamydiales bacterium]
MKREPKNTLETAEELVTCRRCKTCYDPRQEYPAPLNYCLKCSAPLIEVLSTEKLTSQSRESAPKSLFHIDHYQVLRIIKQGGMGEVLLAYDPLCARQIALKRVRSDLLDKQKILPRFLREAKITSQLTHPSIMPIYQIHWEGSESYYTMPYVEGETLGQILRRTLEQQKLGIALDPIGGSLPALLRIFIQTCQAVAYAHAKGVLHRDLKPDNILIGKYGEVLILDWGLVALLSDPSQQDDLLEQDGDLAIEGFLQDENLTSNAFPVGTSHYISPERLLGKHASILSDIYALGVIFYRLLTLEHPFKRPPLTVLVEKIKKLTFDPFSESYIEADIAAPYRDVPDALARIARKCLQPQPNDRYQSVDELLTALNDYAEGRSEWIKTATLAIDSRGDWEFQEHILIAEHVAITRGGDSSEWVLMMLSKQAFEGNTRLEAEVVIADHSEGIGFMLSIPEPGQRAHLNDGYCVWIGSSHRHPTRLLRSTMEIMSHPEVTLRKGVAEKICIERIDNTILLYINDKLKLSYISHTPLQGNRIGIVFCDANFTLSDISIHSSSQSVLVSCLAVPDTFLAKKDYSMALQEYRKISASFPGRSEGREAMFRAGFTLIQKAKHASKLEEKQLLFDDALEEFNKLHATTGAPLELLGKAIVYQHLAEYSEEVKCFELAHRRYPNHPLMNALQEQLLYRMHESACVNRTLAYEFMLLSVRYLKKQYFTDSAKKTFNLLKSYWEPLWFLEEEIGDFSEREWRISLGTTLAFWLAKPYPILEMMQELESAKDPSLQLIVNAFFSLLELGSAKALKAYLDDFEYRWHSKKRVFPARSFKALKICWQALTQPEEIVTFLNSFKAKLNPIEVRAALHLMDRCLDTGQLELLPRFKALLERQILSFDQRLRVDYYLAERALLERNFSELEKIFTLYPIERIKKEQSPLYPLYGCWLAAKEGKEALPGYFSKIDTAYPATPALLGLYLQGRIQLTSGWIKRAFFYEKKQFYRQIHTYQTSIGETSRAIESPFHVDI